MGGVGHHVGVVGHNIQADRVGYVGGVGQAAAGLVHPVGGVGHHVGVVGHNIQADRVGYVGGVGHAVHPPCHVQAAEVGGHVQATAGLVHPVGGVGHHVGVVGHNIQADRVGYVGGVGQAAAGLVHPVGGVGHHVGVVGHNIQADRVGYVGGVGHALHPPCHVQAAEVGGHVQATIWLVSILTGISLHSSCHPLAFLLSV